MGKLNLLFLFTDEQRADTMAAYGNAKIFTPNLNRLANDSVVFEKCYVTQPVCTPSRSSIMTGLYPHTNRCIKNNVPLSESTPCLPELVDGYQTGYFGKWHLGDEVFCQHGFDHWTSIEDNYIAHYREGRDRNARSSYHHWLVNQGYKPDGSNGVFSRNAAARLPEEHGKPAFLAHEVANWLESLEADKPFAAYVNFLEPHMPFTGPRDGQYPLDYIDLPANYPHPPGDDAHLKARMLHAMYRHDGFGGVALDNEQGWRRITANYWGLVSQVDAAVGRILDALSRCGRAENTILVYTSDHGDMMASHQLLAKTVMYEEAVTVPLLLHVPGLNPHREAHIVSQIDLLPTLLDLIGAPIPEALEGQSLRGLIETGHAPACPDVFIQWNGADSGISALERGQRLPDYLGALGDPASLVAAPNDPVRTVITPDRWKLSYSPQLQQHTLYDLNADPGETRNLHPLAEHRGRIEDMIARLRAWGTAHGDSGAATI
ncbi:MAG TPA: sulfatase-like hydrolase/transferase [Candidatus Hydrogenedentes bacterium]|nr:sulfatase-like hydrolase/transferase [Candidatus Hydrogenedentota bacterium]HPG66364.1 sulfatase-like hydrolase/transferase [Candidatus Hydrogenedentota bacterium]